MTGQYRFLQYIVNPFTRHRVTIAALIRSASGSVQVILAPADRVHRQLGSLRAGNLLTSLWRDIQALDSFERLPRSFGPQFVLGSPKPVPAGDPVGWVQARLSAAA